MNAPQWTLYVHCLSCYAISLRGRFTPGLHEAPLKNISVNVKVRNCCDFACCFPRTMRSIFGLERQEVAGGRRKLYLRKASWFVPSPNVKGSNEAERSRNYVAVTAEMTEKVRNVEVPPPPFCGASTQSRVMASPYGASRSLSLDMPHSVGLLWTSDQPDT